MNTLRPYWRSGLLLGFLIIVCFQLYIFITLDLSFLNPKRELACGNLGSQKCSLIEYFFTEAIPGATAFFLDMVTGANSIFWISIFLLVLAVTTSVGYLIDKLIAKKI
ncbi:MAG: hypothetical protein A3I44_05050 [Candidatus Sungbacteria bacterium RIFCSPLOWO2_02_FULL_51_17]|uniref:Uncharacterized protein n=1 Tax=Candidatus Sungbacteria bacterium RIFCSPHIGHO2_02_FULL_51_29 TaxID=1802273 RepID=A0A1G2KWY5_9BACT|nr:MAG: hypothetical protein A3C16_01055 [Candidatus Sungbacteria bacterium RIFCSPHIGHO2_02_FULL_51_29]OHA07555.1 MAG: hypothetical protein A3B29_02085 [Candidatus Sungbacteria bacterium RIFCSPLOWO2_01_FULL_51_34]OHA12222.1 MAG: hypothetical protein A3I44_05050 [Candidatus Sungbacteria bacterium RIFCSPLOWO2_02_FULL_51_17]